MNSDAFPSDETPINRRQEQRLPFKGLTLKVRKSGGLTHHAFKNCQTVDLSFNGLAFSCDTAEFHIPDKIDFILTLKEYEIVGTAIICNKRIDSDHRLQYGIMFLSVTPELSQFLSPKTLTPNDLKALADQQAEKLVTRLREEHHLEQTKASHRQQLFDACRYYLLRLGEMGLRMQVDGGPPLLPAQAVKILQDQQHNLVIRWQDNNQADKQIQFSPTDNPLDSRIIANQQHTLNNIPEALEFLEQYIKPQLHFIVD